MTSFEIGAYVTITSGRLGTTVSPDATHFEPQVATAGTRGTYVGPHSSLPEWHLLLVAPQGRPLYCPAHASQFVVEPGPRTLGDEALANEGNPIPEGKTVQISLRDGRGVWTEQQQATASDSAGELVEWAGNYILCLAAEGMSGSVTWEMIDGIDDKKEEGVNATFYDDHDEDGMT